jgi:hypothetical protein
MDLGMWMHPNGLNHNNNILTTKKCTREKRLDDAV